MTIKRILATIALILAAAMLIVSLAAGIGVWFVKTPLTQRATSLFDRVEAALGIADQGLDQVKLSLDRAKTRLQAVYEEQEQLAREPQKKDASRRFLARSVQRSLAPEFGDAQIKLQAVAEAAVVINSVLEDVGNVPGLNVPGLEGKHLEAINGHLATVSSSAWELSRLLADSSSPAETNEQLSRVEQALQAMHGLVADYEPRLAQVRQRTAELRSRMLGLIGPATVGISIVCIWIALSQIIVLSRAHAWWKRSRLA
jgi:hypothetical protein